MMPPVNPSLESAPGFEGQFSPERSIRNPAGEPARSYFSCRILTYIISSQYLKRGLTGVWRPLKRQEALRSMDFRRASPMAANRL